MYKIVTIGKGCYGKKLINMPLLKLKFGLSSVLKPFIFTKNFNHKSMIAIMQRRKARVFDTPIYFYVWDCLNL
ncbi:MAG: hypothetical protein EAZ57_07725 [Cytophagales bacterium]|nr:MAG: hypothetical protein EAZ67_08810 [Cytophagales bacterium]TAF60426.1 MAG: hypothetical protein EAZ57_07725 [Cytophagales bacterium]